MQIGMLCYGTSGKFNRQGAATKKLAGIGVAMGNAIDEVKDIADVVVGTNDEDGIADYLSNFYTMAGNG